MLPQEKLNEVKDGDKVLTENGTGFVERVGGYLFVRLDSPDFIEKSLVDLSEITEVLADQDDEPVTQEFPIIYGDGADIDQIQFEPGVTPETTTEFIDFPQGRATKVPYLRIIK